MTIRAFIHRLRRSFQFWLEQQQRHRERRFQPVRLEDRRLPDASFALTGTALAVDSFDAGDSLQISYDPGTGPGTESFQLQLTSGIWDVADLPGGPFALSPDLHTLTVGASSLSQLTVDATGNALATVTQGTAFAAGQLTILSGGQVQLNAAANDFDQIAVNSDSAVVYDADDLSVTQLQTTGDATLHAVGALDNTAGAQIDVGGHAEFEGSQITLGTHLGDVVQSASLQFHSAGTVEIHADADVMLSGSSEANSLLLESSGSITNAAGATIDVTNEANFLATSVRLGFEVGDDVKLGQFSATTTSAAELSEDDSTTFGAQVHSDSLHVISQGEITNSAGSSIHVTNNADFEGNSLSLGFQAGDDVELGSLSAITTGAAELSEDDSTLISGTLQSSTLKVISTSDITNADNSSVSVTGLAAFEGNSLTLGFAAADTVNLGSISSTTTLGTSLSENSATLIEGTLQAAAVNLISAGAITNAANSNVTVTGNAAFDGTNLNLGFANNDTIQLGSFSSNTTGATELSEDDSTLITGTVQAASLNVVSTGAITNAAASTVSVTGNASFKGTSLSLGFANNDTVQLGSFSSNTTGATDLSEDDSTLISGTVSAASLTIVSAGSISDAANAAVSITGHAAFDGTSLNLGFANNDSVTLGSFSSTTTGATNLSENDGSLISGTVQAASLNLISTGTISNSAASTVSVSGNASFDGTNISIGVANNDVVTLGSFSANTPGAASLSEDDSTSIEGTVQAASLNIVSAGSITNAATSTVNISGNASFSGTSLSLGFANNDTVQLGSLSSSTTGSTAVSEDSSTLLEGIVQASTLNIVSTGSITNAANSTVNIAGNASFRGTSLNLGFASNDSVTLGSFSSNTTGASELFENDGTLISGTVQADSLKIVSVSAISNAANSTVNVTNNASFNGTSLNLGFANNDNIQLGSFSSTTTGAAALSENDSTLIEGTVQAASLNLVSAGSITNAANAGINVTNNASFNGASLNLGFANNDNVTLGSFSSSTAGATALSENDSTLIEGTVQAASLNLVSTSSMTNAANAIVNITSNASFTGASLNLGFANNDSVTLGSFSSNTTGATTLSENDSTLIEGTVQAASLNIVSAGSISNAANSGVNITNNASFNGASLDLGFANNDNVTLGSFSSSTTGATALSENDSTLIEGTVQAASLNLVSTGSMTNAANSVVNITNNASFNGASLNLGFANNDNVTLGSFSATTTGATALSENDSTLIEGTVQAASLNIVSTGSITNAANSSVSVTNNASFSGVSLNLGNANNDNIQLGSFSSNTTGATVLSENDSTLIEGTVQAASLNIASSGSITNSANSSVSITNNASFNGTSLNLGFANNDQVTLGSFSSTTTGATALSENDNTLIEGTVQAASLNIVSTGSISNAANSNVSITNNASFNGTSLNLGFANNDQVTLGSFSSTTTGATALSENDGTLIEGTVQAASLNLVSTGSISNAANSNVSITNNASFNGTSLNLGFANNDNVTLGSFTSTTTGAAELSENDSTLIEGTLQAASLNIVSTGSISNAASSSVSITNNASFNGTSLNLGFANNDNVTLGSFSSSTTGATALSENDSTLIEGTVQAASLNMVSTGSITNADSSSINVTNNASFVGTSLNLGFANNDNVQLGSFSSNTTGATVLSENNSTLIEGTVQAASLNLVSAGSISNAANSNVNITNNASFNGTSLNLGFANNDSITLGSFSSNTTGATALSENGDTLLDSQLQAGSALIRSTGNITNSPGLAVNVTGLLDLSANTITLGNNPSDSVTMGSLHFQSTGATTITANGIVLESGNQAQTVQLNSLSGISAVSSASTTITADTTTLVATNGIGTASVRVVLDTDQLQTQTGASQFLRLTGSTTLNLLKSDSGSIDIVGTDLIDGNGTNVNLDAAIGSIQLQLTGDAGQVPADVFKPGLLDVIETRSQQLSFQTPGDIAIRALQNVSLGNISGRNIWLTGDGNLNLSSASVTATNLGLIAVNGVVTLSNTLQAQQDLTVQTRDLLPTNGTSTLVADRLLLKSQNSATVQIDTRQLDASSNQSLTLLNRRASLELQDLDCDLVAISTPGGFTELRSTGLLPSSITQALPITAQQNSRILADGLLLTGNADVLLSNSTNDINTLASQHSGRLTLVDVDDLTIGTVRSTAGVTSDDHDVLLETGGALQLTQGIDAADSDIRLLVTGSIQQTGGSLIGNHLGIHQQKTQSSDIILNSTNDVNILAVRNDSRGDIQFNDTDDLVIDSVSRQSHGTVLFGGVSGLTSAGGDIIVQANNDLTILKSVVTGDGVEDITSATGETIRLSSVDGNLIVDATAGAIVISTDENLLQSNAETGDRIQLIADSNGSYNGDLDGDSIGDELDPDMDGDTIPNDLDGTADGAVEGRITLTGDVTLRSDGGVAHRFGPRPSVGQLNTAFFEFITDPLPLALDNSNAAWNNANAYIDAFYAVIGASGEENLLVSLDWQDPVSEHRVLTDALTQQIAQNLGVTSPVSSDRIQQYLVEQGGLRNMIGHLYTSLDMTLFQTQLRQTTIHVELSVSQHPSLAVTGSWIEQTGTTQAVPGRDVASSDNALTGPNVFENGHAQFRIPTVTPAPPALFSGAPVQQFERLVVPAPPEVQVTPDPPVSAELGGGAVSGSAFSTDVFFQIRRQFEADQPAEVVIERLTNSRLISSREALEKFIAQNPELQDGAGYEIWLISETGGRKVERPIVEFEITGGHPGPAREQSSDSEGQMQLIDLPFELPKEPDSPPPNNNAVPGNETPQAAVDPEHLLDIIQAGVAQLQMLAGTVGAEVTR
ncbi:MAG: hypothetical protein JNM43_07795 [Planctomycetaceae bacterium]|nr:hypothetical protein [Planctomycetaceae bacterium]